MTYVGAGLKPAFCASNRAGLKPAPTKEKMTYNPEIHHRRSIRLKEYDYSQSGAYFVTVCAWKKECLFGEIKNGEMLLNKCGGIVMNCWDDLPNHYQHAQLDEFVIMPNHVHGIIVLKNTDCRKSCGPLKHSHHDVSMISGTLAAFPSGNEIIMNESSAAKRTYTQSANTSDTIH
jgi:REP element-mobilizing transposase RayT